MCHYREEGGGPRDAMYARLRRNIRQNGAQIVALEATVRRRQRWNAELRAQAAALELVLVWIQAETVRLRAESVRLDAETVRLRAETKRIRARTRRYKLYICILFLLNLLAIFLLGAIVKKLFKY